MPDEAIQVLSSTSTWEDGQAIAALAQQRNVRSVLIVTNWYHSRRAMCVVRQHLRNSGVSVYYDPPPGAAVKPDNWWRSEQGRDMLFTELAKIGYYWVRYGLAPVLC